MPEDLKPADELAESGGAGENQSVGTLSTNTQGESAGGVPTEASAATAVTSPSKGRVRIRDLSFFSPLRIANFRWYLSGQEVSRLGDQFYLTALPWLILTISPTPIALALVVGLNALANAAFTLWGGVLADRYGPRAIVLGSDIARFFAISAIAALAVMGNLTLLSLIGLTVFFGIASGLFRPAAGAMVPYMVPRTDLQAGNSLDQLSFNSSAFAGPSLAGLILNASRLVLGIVLDAASFAFSVVSLLFIHFPPRPARVQDALSEATVGDGITFLRRSPLLWRVVGFSLVGNFAVLGLADVALPLFLKHEVGIDNGPQAFGFVIGGIGLGSILGLFAGGILARIQHKPLVGILCYAPVAVLIALMPLIPGVFPLAALCVILGALLGLASLLFLTVIQRLTPMLMMGRIISLNVFSYFIVRPFSDIAYGITASNVSNLAWLFFGGAILLGGATLLMLTSKVTWGIPGSATVAAEAM